MNDDPRAGQGTLKSLLKQGLLFTSAVWTGSTIGGIGLLVGLILESGFTGLSPYPLIVGFLAAPLLLISLWGIPNLAVLLLGLSYFVGSENTHKRAWIILAGIESLVVMLGWEGTLFPEWLPRLAAWIGWLAALTMVASGIWLLRAYRINRWARQLAASRAEREARERAAAAAEARSIGAGEGAD